MARTGADIREDNVESDSNDTGRGGGPDRSTRGMTPAQAGGPLLAALQRSARGPQVSAPGPGNMAAGLGQLKIAVDMMQTALQGFEPESKPYVDISNALDKLTPYLPQMGNQSQLERTHIMDILQKAKQNPVLQALSNLIGGGGAPEPQGPQPPMPSTPLPGA